MIHEPRKLGDKIHIEITYRLSSELTTKIEPGHLEPHGLFCICGHARDIHGYGAVPQCEYHIEIPNSDHWLDNEVWRCPCKKFADVREVEFECPK